MTERNEYVDALKSEFDAYSEKVTEIFDAYQEGLIPPPGPIIPRPVLPANFRVQGRGRTVSLSWSMPLPRETPGVQVQRRAEDPEISNWKSLTKEAIDGWSDIISEDYAEAESVWIYRIRGYGYNADGVAHASAWSEEVSYVIEIDPPVPPPSFDFIALNCAENSAAQNKLVALPAMRAERAPRTSVGAIGDVKRGDWTQGDLLKENMESVVPKGYTQWSSNLHQNYPTPRPGKYTWKNIGVSPELLPELARQLKWGTREYNSSLREFIDCDFTDIPREHGFYVSNYAGTLIDQCTFLRCGSQGAQWAHRERAYQQYDPDCLPYSAKPSHVIRDSHFVDNAYKGDRPSFNATFFHPGCSEFPGELLVENCSFVCDWPETRSDGKKSTGALVVTPTGENAPLRDICMMERVHIKNSLFDFTKGDRSICSIRSVDQILIEDSCFIAREHTQPNVTIDKDYGAMGNTKTKRIVVRNCVAEGINVHVFLAADSEGKQASKNVPMHCPGEEIVIDGVTGEIISRTTLS